MTPLKVFFTGLELSPATLADRIHAGVIPDQWGRYRFHSNAPLGQINRWLAEHIEGRWAIFCSWRGPREVTIAFENDYDGAMFVLSDGPRQFSHSDLF